jgi:hypothetical protein
VPHPTHGSSSHRCAPAIGVCPVDLLCRPLPNLPLAQLAVPGHTDLHGVFDVKEHVGPIF